MPSEQENKEKGQEPKHNDNNLENTQSILFNYQQFIPNVISNSSYLLQYLPNWEEVLVVTSLATIIEIIMEPVINLSGNTVAKEVFRDMAKIPGTSLLDYLGINVGKTNYKYDDANEIAQYVRVGCKLSLIVPTYYYFGQKPAVMMAYISNPICDIPAQTIIRIGKLKQDENDTTTSIFQYYVDNINNDIVTGSIIASFIKKGVATIIGSIIDLFPKTPYQYAKSSALKVDKALLAIFGINRGFIIDEDAKNTCAQVATKIYQNLVEASITIKAAILPLAVTTEFLFREAANMFNAYILMSAARPIQEASYDLYIKYANNTSNFETIPENTVALDSKTFDTHGQECIENIYNELLGNEVCKVDEL